MTTLRTLSASLILLTVSQLHAALLSQPDVVFGEAGVQTGSHAGSPAPGKARHTETARGRWRVYDGQLPSLEELKTFPDDPTPIYGLYTGTTLYSRFRQDIKAVGFSSLRVNMGHCTQAQADAAILEMIEDGMSITCVLNAPKRDEFDTDEAYIESALASFAKMIERYGPGGSLYANHPDAGRKPVTSFQVLNEPNFQYMYKGSNDAKMIPIRHKLYAKLLPRTYAMIKKRWPQVTVVGWTCGGAAAQDLFFVTNALKFNPAMAESFDVFSTHPYMQPAPPETFALASWGGYAIIDMLNKIRATFAKAGRPASTLGVWYTEGGWRLRHADGGIYESGHLSPDLHAAYYLRYYAIGLRMGVNRIMPMYVCDADGFNGGIFNRTENWQRDNAKPMRKAAYAIQTMIRLMPNPKLKRIIADGADGYFAYEFTADKRDPNSPTTVMAWSVTAGGKTKRIPVSYDQPTITDMVGTSEPAKRSDGHVEATVGPYPIYITGGKPANR